MAVSCHFSTKRITSASASCLVTFLYLSGSVLSEHIVLSFDLIYKLFHFSSVLIIVKH